MVISHQVHNACKGIITAAIITYLQANWAPWPALSHANLMILLVDTMKVTPLNESLTSGFYSVSLPDMRFHHRKCKRVRRQILLLLLSPSVRP